MSRAELAEAVNDYLWHTTGRRYGLDAHTIARYERGKVRWPSTAYRAGLKAVLGAETDADLGFRPSRRGGSRASEVRESVTVTVDSGQARAALQRRVETGDVAAIRHMLDALTVSDRRFGGGHLREQASSYFSILVQPRLQARADERTRRELLTCATEFALRVASMELDAGRVAQSRSLVGVATRLAHETDDLVLGAWALARRGEQEIHEAVLADQRGLRSRRDSGIQRALACTGAATSLAAGAPPMAQAFILIKHALALSMTGDRAEVGRLVTQVWRHYERMGVASEPSWMSVYGWGHLRHEESRCYANLGMGHETVRTALEGLRARSDARPRAMSMGIVALGRTSAKDIDGASEAGRELAVLAESTASQRIRVRLAEVLSALRPHRSLSEVRDLYEAARPVVHGIVYG